MYKTRDELFPQLSAETANDLVPEAYLVRQRLRNLLTGTVMSKRAALRVNMARINAYLDRGDRSGFERLARERLFIQREWLD